MPILQALLVEALLHLLLVSTYFSTIGFEDFERLACQTLLPRKLDCTAVKCKGMTFAKALTLFVLPVDTVTEAAALCREPRIA